MFNIAKSINANSQFSPHWLIQSKQSKPSANITRRKSFQTTKAYLIPTDCWEELKLAPHGTEATRAAWYYINLYFKNDFSPQLYRLILLSTCEFSVFTSSNQNSSNTHCNRASTQLNKTVQLILEYNNKLKSSAEIPILESGFHPIKPKQLLNIYKYNNKQNSFKNANSLSIQNWVFTLLKANSSKYLQREHTPLKAKGSKHLQREQQTNFLRKG